MQYFIIIYFMLSFCVYKSLETGGPSRSAELYRIGEVPNDLSKSFEDTQHETQHKDYEDLRLGMPVDHCSKSKGQDWFMRFLKDTTHWKSDSPIYILVGGREKLDTTFFSKGFMSELAAETGGVMFALELRYYGDSIPHKDLKYLTSNQTLTDLYKMVQYIKSKKQYRKSKVVLVGGGYGGTLAVWFKISYPKLVDVVLASSAPLLFKVDFDDYLKEAVKNFHDKMSPQCVQNLQKLYVKLNNFLCTGNLTSMVRMALICDYFDMNERENHNLFYHYLVTLVAREVERGIAGMKRICNMAERETSKLKPKQEFEYCFDCNFESVMKSIKNDSEKKLKYHLYQSCTEFGLFPTTSAFRLPFSENVPLRFFYKICSYLFGPMFDQYKLDQAVQQINRRYGELKPKVKNVIFVHGVLDPWKSRVVTDRYSNHTKVIKIENESHCRELYPKQPSDSLELSIARYEITELIKKMLGYANNNLVS